MINKISLNQNTSYKNSSAKTSFKAKLFNEDDFKAIYEADKGICKRHTKSEALAWGIGISAACASKALGKKDSFAINMLAGSCLTTMVLSNGAQKIKKSKEAEELYKPKEEPKNVFDKFFSLMLSPEPIDFKDEKKNEKYYQISKENNKKNFKATVKSCGIGAALAAFYAVFSKEKNLVEKLGKASMVFWLAECVSILAQSAKGKIKTQKAALAEVEA